MASPHGGPGGTRPKRNWVAWLALAVSALTLVATGIQALFAFEQTRELREQFARSGPVLTANSALQLKFNDNRQGPPNASDDQYPVVSSRDFDTFDSINLVVTVTNVGRLESKIIDVKLQVAPNVTINASDDNSAAVASCSVSGGGLVDCRKALPFTLNPGDRYYIYFPLKDVRDRFREPFVRVGLPIEIQASGTPTVHFRSGVQVQPS